MITIKNLHNNTPLLEGEEYCGRPCKYRPELGSSVLSNPYFIYSREENIKKYKEWIEQKIKQNNSKIIEELERLFQKALVENLVLCCWCKNSGEDLGCHCDVIQDILEKALGDYEKIS